MSEQPRVFRNFCRFCGGIITSPKSIARGYGPTCWQRFKPKPIKPYIQETPYTEIGDRTHQIKIYSSLGDMF